MLRVGLAPRPASSDKESEARENSDFLYATLQGNDEFVAKFDKATTGKLPLPPGKQTLVLACMDARLHPEKVINDYVFLLYSVLMFSCIF